jgi:ATP-dependent DNA helicase RecQ
LILCGARRTEILNLNVQQSSHFGALRHLKQDQVLDYLRALENAGYLETTGGDYPCLMLSSDGEDLLEYPENISLNLRNPRSGNSTRARKKAALPKEKAAAAAPENTDRRLLERAALREELRLYRLELAQQNNVKAFQIFSDAVLNELVIQMPVSLEECTQIKGISKQKAEQLMSGFLEIIRRYRQENMS